MRPPPFRPHERARPTARAPRKTEGGERQNRGCKVPLLYKYGYPHLSEHYETRKRERTSARCRARKERKKTSARLGLSRKSSRQPLTKTRKRTSIEKNKKKTSEHSQKCKYGTLRRYSRDEGRHLPPIHIYARTTAATIEGDRTQKARARNEKETQECTTCRN